MASGLMIEAPDAPAIPGDPDVLYEIVDGEMREVPHMGAVAGAVASFLSQYLGMFALQNRLGMVVTEVMFQLKSSTRQRRPDLAFISTSRWQAAPPPPQDDPPAFDVVPNLAVEVVSPSNTAQEIEDKIQEYIDAGVELVWVFHPRHRRIYVYEPNNQVRLLGEHDELDGGTVLPGFRLPMAALFDPMAKPQ